MHTEAESALHAPIASATRTPTVGIVHDYLTQFGGAERVVLALSRTFPAAPILTSVYEPRLTFPDFESRVVETSPLQRSATLRRHHRAAMPLYPVIFNRMQVDADVVICSTSGWAHGVRTDGAKVLLVHNPARWLYQGTEYLGEAPRWQRAAAISVRHPMRRWDRRAAHTADLVLAVSNVVKERIHRSWGLDATVVHPPHGVDPQGAVEPVPGVEPGFLLCVARLRWYKHVDAVLAAMQTLTSDHLVVVGGGVLGPQLHGTAPSNVTFLNAIPDSQLRWLYANARLLVAAAEEDFGLTPLEAMAFGTPVAALRQGGYLETVIEEETGVFFDRAEPDDIAAAVRLADLSSWSETRLRQHADRFSESAFATAIRDAVSGVAALPITALTSCATPAPD